MRQLSAAAMAAKDGVSVKNIDVNRLRETIKRGGGVV